MPLRMSKFQVCALLLGLVFLAAQFHFCLDLNANHDSTHFCPYCAGTSSAVTTASPTIGISLAMVRLEVMRGETPDSQEVLLSLSSRAPPAV